MLGSSATQMCRSFHQERVVFGWTTFIVLEMRQTLLCVHTTGGVCITVVIARMSTYSASCQPFPSLLRVRHTDALYTHLLFLTYLIDRPRIFLTGRLWNGNSYCRVLSFMINCYNTSKLKSHPTALTCGLVDSTHCSGQIYSRSLVHWGSLGPLSSTWAPVPWHCMPNITGGIQRHLSVFLVLDSIHAEHARPITYAITRPSSVRHTDGSVEVAVHVRIMQYWPCSSTSRVQRVVLTCALKIGRCRQFLRRIYASVSTKFNFGAPHVGRQCRVHPLVV